IHWTGFLHSKQLKNDKARRYNAKCTYCAQIFEAHKEAMTNHMLNLCRKILAKSKILYSCTVNKKKSEEVTEVPTHKAVLVTDYFDKAILSSEKTNELYTLLLRALVYSNIPFTFAENLFFILFLNSNGFQTCLEYNNNFPNECPSFPTKIKEIITSHRHFFENEQFTTVLRYIVDAIAKLESNNTILGDIFAELLFIYKKLKSSEFEDFDYGLIDHAKNIVNFQAKEFDEPIYYLAFFLNPKFRKIALSKKLTYDDIVVYALTFAQKWSFIHFTDEEDNELEFSHIQEISLESIQNNSESFMEEFINFDIIEELITISDKVKQNIDKNENTSNWTLDDILNTGNK
ncbi:26320_t:CDS:2, partial [Dentiscutata erythropus]